MGLLLGRLRVGHVALVATATLLASACGTTALNPLGRDGNVWVKRGAWSGHGDMQTDSFPGKTTGGLRLTWAISHQSGPGAGTFVVSVHNAESRRKLADAIDARRADHGTAFISQPPQMFYLVVDSKDVDWTVTVEETVPSS